MSIANSNKKCVVLSMKLEVEPFTQLHARTQYAKDPVATPSVLLAFDVKLGNFNSKSPANSLLVRPGSFKLTETKT